MTVPRSSALLRGLDALAGLWLLYILFAISGAGIGRVAWLVVIWGGAVLVAAWAVLWRAGGATMAVEAGPAALAVVPVAALVVAVLLLAGRPPHNSLFRLRFAASRAALAEEADGVLIHPPPAGRHRVGLYRVTTEASPGTVRFRTADCDRGAGCGFLYQPGRLTAIDPGEKLTDLGGPWHHFEPTR
jgi:hypothetical protein